MSEELSARHRRFIDEYLVDHNATRAARAAGYSPASAHVTGCRLLRNANVAAAIQARQAEVERRLELDRQKVIERLQEAIEIARIKADPAAMIRGWVEIARMCGYYAPERTQVEINTSSAALGVRIRELGDEELLALAEAPADMPGKGKEGKGSG
jgi:phage terminase small subunit